MAARVPRDHFGVGRRLSTRPQEPYNRPPLDRYSANPGNYQTTPPNRAHAPWPQYFPPRQQVPPPVESRQHTMPPLPLFPMPEPTVPASTPSHLRIPSISVSQSVSPFDSPTPSPSSPVRRAEPVMSTQIPPIRSRTTSPSPPISSPELPRASLGPTSPKPLAPIDTGISTNVDEPPPAYTPI
ncbi:hypothetical protein BU15DRAFT_77597 [Melanogaster broomeanus]|nr:hypothetical protein BU15DRAFT_77597 [Melanogaster broomeanus]